jgi:hypothetical protein
MFPSASRVPQVSAQQSRTVTIPNLAPGAYRVVAFDKEQELDPSDPERMALLTANSVVINVSAGSTAHVQLDIQKSGNEGATQ